MRGEGRAMPVSSPSTGRPRGRSPASVSVVIPTYNRADVLGRAIESVLDQSLPVLEVIVVDDESTDSTGDLVAGLQDDRIVYLRHERRRGASAARNTGIRACRGEWVAFLDSDDEWRLSKAERQVGMLDAFPDLDAMYCSFERVDDGSRRVVKAPAGADLKDLLLARQYVITLSTLMVKREVIVSVGMFDESLPSYQDTDLFLRLVSSARFGYLDDVLVVQDVNRGDRITGDLELRVRGYRRILDKHHTLLRTDKKGFASYWFELGRLNLLAGDHSRGRAAFFRALLLNPARFKTYVRLMECMGGESVVRWVRTLRRRWGS